jgi:chromosome segregation protein
VHLRAIRIRGFKSFPDPVEVRLEPGVAVVVGPNGSGKSNVADALLWAAGSLSPSELRAEKPDDVLYAGSGGRPAASYCQVELVLDNEDGALADLPFAEISIMRRLHRGGEGQYLINGTAVRRTDLVEVLADVGLGGAAGSVISQGRVEEILASKPEERRALVEEAAGLGKFKRRRHRAELKLARVAQDVARARDVEAEVKKRLRPLALQATAAQRAEKLGREIAGLEAAIATLDLGGIHEQIAAAEERRAAAEHAGKRSTSKLEDLLAERNSAEEELADAAGRRESATAALYRLRSAAERVALRRESAATLVESLTEAAATPRLPIDLRRQRLRDEVQERLRALERMLAEREGVPPAARALGEAGHPLVLSKLDVPPGDERAVAAALRGPL